MALTNAEKQAQYRERHLGDGGKKARLQLFLSVHARAQLARLAHHKGYTITAVVEELAAQAERRVTSQLRGAALTAYLDRK